MGRRFILILGFALVMGLVTGTLVYRAITQRIEVEASVQPTEEIVVAAANIKLGETVTSQHVRLMSWPKGSVPEGTLQSIAEVEGRVALGSMVVGEPLLDAKLSAQLAGEGGLLPMLVPANLRGVTIKVDDALKESGFVSPNSRVDVVVSIADPGSRERTAKVILQNVPVLAAGQSVEMRGNKPVPVTTVTLALTPEQSERLALAKTEGKLMLATRNLGDEQIVETSGTNVNRLLDGSSAPPRKKSTPSRVARKPQPRSYTVSVLHGNQMTEHHFVEKGDQQWVEQGQ